MLEIKSSGVTARQDVGETATQQAGGEGTTDPVITEPHLTSDESSAVPIDSVDINGAKITMSGQNVSIEGKDVEIGKFYGHHARDLGASSSDTETTTVSTVSTTTTVTETNTTADPEAVTEEEPDLTADPDASEATSTSTTTSTTTTPTPPPAGDVDIRGSERLHVKADKVDIIGPKVDIHGSAGVESDSANLPISTTGNVSSMLQQKHSHEILVDDDLEDAAQSGDKAAFVEAAQDPADEVLDTVIADDGAPGANEQPDPDYVRINGHKVRIHAPRINVTGKDVKISKKKNITAEGAGTGAGHSNSGDNSSEVNILGQDSVSIDDDTVAVEGDKIEIGSSNSDSDMMYSLMELEKMDDVERRKQAYGGGLTGMFEDAGRLSYHDLSKAHSFSISSVDSDDSDSNSKPISLHQKSEALSEAGDKKLSDLLSERTKLQRLQQQALRQ